MMNGKNNCSLRAVALVLSLAAALNLMILSVSGYLVRGVSANGLSSVQEIEGVVYAVTNGNKLINFNAITPGAVIGRRFITAHDRMKSEPAPHRSTTRPRTPMTKNVFRATPIAE